MESLAREGQDRPGGRLLTFTARKRVKKILAIVLLDTVILALILGGLEIHYRRKASWINDRKAAATRALGCLANSPDALYRITPRGRRLIPEADVILRNHRLNGRNISIKTNSLGFRDRELAPVKASNETRVLVLGDSITFGDYLEADEVWLERAERYLGGARPDLSVEMINAGVGNIGLREEVDIYEEAGRKTLPDLVLVAFYLNDSRPPWGFEQEAGSYGVLRRNSLLAREICRRLRLQRWLDKEGMTAFDWVPLADKLDWRSNRTDFERLAKAAACDWGAAWRDDSWDLVEKELDRLASLSRRDGARVCVVMFPVAFQVYADFLDDRPQQRMREICAARGIESLDLLPVLRERRDRRLFFDHCHPTAETNDLAGASVAAFLLEKNLLERNKGQVAGVK